MMKNGVIAVLAAVCVFLSAYLYREHMAWEEEEITPAEYGGLLALRELYSAGEYRDRVEPLLRQAFVDGKITRARLRELGKRLDNTGAQTFKVLGKESTSERVSKAWDDARDGAAALGESLGRQMGEALRELGDAVKELSPDASGPKRVPKGGVQL